MVSSSSDVESGTGRAGTGYVLVHRIHARGVVGVVGQEEPVGSLFPPLKIMNPVTYLGRLPGNDLVLPSTNVSRRHAKLIVTDLGVTVHDLDSHNGIFLNGKKVRSTPVSPGDLLYIGDVCVELQLGGDRDGYDGGSSTAVVHNDISDEDDPRARGFAALVRMAEICAMGSDESWAPDAIQICRELVEATVGVLVEVHADGDLETPVVLQPESGRKGPAPVLWEVVQKAISTQQPQFSRDTADGTLLDVVKEGDPRAVMAIPVLVGDLGVAGVIFLSRAQAGSVFSQLEFEAMQGIGRLIGLRLERTARPPEVTSVGEDADLIAARAKLMTAEELLSAEQSEVERLTSRMHTLEGENLKLRQQSDLERQGLHKQQADKERESIARLEATLAEQKKQTQKDLTTLQTTLQKEVERQKAEVEKQREAARVIDEDRRGRATDAEKQKARAAEAEDALVEARSSLQHTEGKLAFVEAALVETKDKLTQAREAEAAARAAAEGSRGDGAALAAATAATTTAEAATAAAEAAAAVAVEGTAVLRTALRASVLPTLVDHVEAVAAGEAVTTPAHARQLTVLYLALADFDAFCDKASVDDVKIRLDRFCGAISARAPANGGRVDQVIGHAHLLVFASDPSSVLAAVRCAIEVGAIVDAEARSEGSGAQPGVPEPAVVAGVHSGMAIAGFFGGEDGVSYIEAGLPLVVARAAVDQAPPGKDGTPRGVVVSEVVRAIVAGDPGFRVTRLGPAWVKGVNAPVPLALVELEDAEGSR
ncbi:MAG: FHA domain-containing protein [Deltaproteobacteria bacterium]|nr:FHA domain-containing protein [Deltaproteobacteria bacterium]